MTAIHIAITKSSWMRTLPEELIDSIGFNYGRNWMCAGLSKSWHETYKRHVVKSAIKIQSSYRMYRGKHKTADWYSHSHIVRNYILYYPMYFLQRWPDLALRKCPELQDAQRQCIESLPPTTQRTRRDVRNVLYSLNPYQIRYVGW